MARPRIRFRVIPDPARDGILIAGHWLPADDARQLADTIHDVLEEQGQEHHDANT